MVTTVAFDKFHVVIADDYAHDLTDNLVTEFCLKCTEQFLHRGPVTHLRDPFSRRGTELMEQISNGVDVRVLAGELTIDLREPQAMAAEAASIGVSV